MSCDHADSTNSRGMAPALAFATCLFWLGTAHAVHAQTTPARRPPNTNVPPWPKTEVSPWPKTSPVPYVFPAAPAGPYLFDVIKKPAYARSLTSLLKRARLAGMDPQLGAHARQLCRRSGRVCIDRRHAVRDVQRLQAARMRRQPGPSDVRASRHPGMGRRARGGQADHLARRAELGAAGGDGGCAAAVATTSARSGASCRWVKAGQKRAPVRCGTGAAVSAAWWEELDAAELG